MIFLVDTTPFGRTTPRPSALLSKNVMKAAHRLGGAMSVRSTREVVEQPEVEAALVVVAAGRRSSGAV
jgi:hypothetical protein